VKRSRFTERADHWDPARAGDRRGGGGPVQEARAQLVDLPQVEGQVRRADRSGRSGAGDNGYFGVRPPRSVEL